MTPQTEILCAKDVARVLGIGERTAARLMSRGEIQSFNLGPRLVRTTRRRITDYIERQFTAKAQRLESTAVLG